MVIGKRFLSCEQFDKANCCVLLENKSYIVIEIFVEIDNKPFIVGKMYSDPTNFITHPLDSSDIGISKVSQLELESQIWPLREISNKCFRVPFSHDENSFLVYPLISEDLEW